MRKRTRKAAVKLVRPETIAMESGRFCLNWDVLRDERAGDRERAWTEGRGQRVALRLRNAAVLVDVPGDVMARLMRLHSDGTGDSNAEVIQRMLSALEAAARRMPAASTTIPALPSPIHDA